LATDFKFRKDAVGKLTRSIGVYVLCDLDGVPLYVGQSKDGIRGRVARHLTSARSDMIANRQLDVWKIAYVWAYPVHEKEEVETDWQGDGCPSSVYLNTMTSSLGSPVQRKVIKATTDPQRSATMRAVKSKDTEPELKVRRFVHALGFRYRLHRKDLPGKPDLVFSKLKKVIFVHGCFWHGHDCCRGARVPKNNSEYWRCKVSRNQERHRRQIKALNHLGWQELIVWECHLKAEAQKTEGEIKRFLMSLIT
jgi:DNA mismatch endonuclease (patch repair protein)